jgi:hypothetical protein
MNILLALLLATLPVSLGRSGVIAYATVSDDYVAIPIGPGHTIEVCAARCIIVTSTDAGPNHAMLKAGRIMDLAAHWWVEVCQLPLSAGTCVGSWRVVGALVPPATDADPVPTGGRGRVFLL